MPIETRNAIAADLDAVAELTARLRRRLAGWSPRWWRMAERADATHKLWLAHLIEAQGPVVRVTEEEGAVIGCAVSRPQPGQWFIDDVALTADDRWADAGRALMAAVLERPALTCVPVGHVARARAGLDAGLACVSRYWIGPPRPAGPAAAVTALTPASPVPAGPPHTFGGSLDPHAAGSIALADGAGSLVVASPPITAPPVYDPGGTVAVVGRLVGDRPRMLDAALDASARRRDVLAAVVAPPDDPALAGVLEERGFAPVVDVFAWS